MCDIDSRHYRFARLAVDKAKLCPADPKSTNEKPRVAIVIAVDEEWIGWYAKGHGGEYRDGTVVHAIPASTSKHAEHALLEALEPRDLSNATAYVTLEPCTKKKGKGDCCADLIVRAGIREVHVGNVDPNPDVGALAWRTFLSNDVQVRDFASDLRNEAARDNHAFLSKFRSSPYMEQGASYDYEKDGGTRLLGPEGKQFLTRWTERGDHSIYALDYENNVSLAKNCKTFEQVDDPGRWFEDQHYTKAVHEGEIVIFRNEYGYALVEVLLVRLATATTNAELKFRFQIRYFDHLRPQLA